MSILVVNDILSELQICRAIDTIFCERRSAEQSQN